MNGPGRQRFAGVSSQVAAVLELADSDPVGALASLGTLEPSPDRRTMVERALVEAQLLGCVGEFGRAALAAAHALEVARGEMAARPGPGSERLVLLAADEVMRSALQASGPAGLFDIADDFDRRGEDVAGLDAVVALGRARALESVGYRQALGAIEEIEAEGSCGLEVELARRTWGLLADLGDDDDDDALVGLLDCADRLVSATAGDYWGAWEGTRGLLVVARTLAELGALGGHIEQGDRPIDVVLRRAAQIAPDAAAHLEVAVTALEVGTVRWGQRPVVAIGPADFFADEPVPEVLAGWFPADVMAAVAAGAAERIGNPQLLRRVLRQRAMLERGSALGAFRRAGQLSRNLSDLNSFCEDILGEASVLAIQGEHQRAAKVVSRALDTIELSAGENWSRERAELAAARELLLRDPTPARSVYISEIVDSSLTLTGHRPGPAGSIRVDAGPLSAEVDALDMSVLRIAAHTPEASATLTRRLGLDVSADHVAVAADHPLLVWLGSLAAVLAAFSARVPARPLSTAALALQWSSLCNSDEGQQWMTPQDQTSALNEARAAFDTLPETPRLALRRIAESAETLVAAFEQLRFGGIATPFARSEAVSFARSLRSIGIEAPDMATLDEELAALVAEELVRRDRSSLPSVTARPVAEMPTEDDDLWVGRAEAERVTRLAAVGERRGEPGRWDTARRLWAARAPGSQESETDAAVVLSGLALPDPRLVSGVGWPRFRALLLAARRKSLAPVTTWDLRYEAAELAHTPAGR